MTDFNVDFDKFGVGIVHHFGGGVYAKETIIPANCELQQHVHSFDHLSILAKGKVIVSVDGNDGQEFNGPACIVIAANKAHKVAALTDATWYCIHATEETDPDKIDHTLIGGA